MLTAITHHQFTSPMGRARGPQAPCQTRRKRYHVAKLTGGKSAKPRTALLWTIITSVVVVGLIVVFPLALALPGMHLLTLSRWQFAITVCFHILFPSITVGTSILLCVLYGMYWKTQRPVYLQMFRFWRLIFAVGFAIGVVAGIVLVFEFGVLCGVFATKAGPIMGPLL